MIDEAQPDVFGYTIFCDDIRQEVTGKLILIGVYQGLMTVHGTFPVTLPRLSFSFSLSQKKELFSPNIALRIFVPGDSDDAPSIEARMVEDTEGAVKKSVLSMIDSPESGSNYLTVRSNLAFENFVLTGEGLIVVRIDVNSKRYLLGSLRIVQVLQPKDTPAKG